MIYTEILKGVSKPKGTESHINTFNYDRDNLISYVPDNSLENPSNAIPPYYLIFSKQDGSITRKISIPFDEVKSPVARDGENWENWAAPVPTAMYQIVPDHTNWVLMETSSDTIYHYLPDANTTIPLIVRTPPYTPWILLKYFLYQPFLPTVIIS